MLALTLACARGSIEDPVASTPVVSAYSRIDAEGDRDHMLLLLSNTRLPTHWGSEMDPEVVSELTREGARYVALDLYRFRVDSWKGLYPVAEEGAAAAVDDLRPRASQGAYLSIDETSIDLDGLAVDTSDSAIEQVTWLALATSGGVDLRWEREQYMGSFHLEDVDVSGTFRTEPCPTGDLNICDVYPALLTGLVGAGAY